MIVVMHKDATREQIARVMDQIAAAGLRPVDMPGGERTAVGVASAIPPELRGPLTSQLESLPGVQHVTQVSRPYKLASREFHPADTVVQVGEVAIGGSKVVLIAGPCAVENREQMRAAARAVKEAGGSLLRGGAYKPRTSPYSFQGLEEEGLRLLQAVGEEMGLPTVSEVLDPHDVELVASHVDLLQIGARNMQNYPLLVAAGKSGRPVLLKRGMSASLDEWLLAAEYVMSAGESRVILCERGVHPLDHTYTRYTLDLSCLPVLKELTHLPVVVDPSHATGNARLVPAMCKAAVAAGADGLMVEVHPRPEQALCDGPQSLASDTLAQLMAELGKVSAAVGRQL